MTTQLEQQLQRHLHYLQQDPQNSNLLLTISDYYRQLGQLNLADDYLNQAKTIITNEAQFLQAQGYQQRQESDKAITILEQLINVYPEHANSQGLLSLLYFDNNQIEKAQLACDNALILNNKQPEACLVHLLLKTLAHTVSISELQAQLDITPQECRLWFALGSVAMNEMNYLTANDAFLQAIAIWPDFYDAWIYSGWCYLVQNKPSNAKQAWQKASELDEEKADAWAGLALINALEDKELIAKEYLTKSREKDEQCFLIAMTDIILLNKHHPEKAADILETIAPNLASQMSQLSLELNKI